MVLKRCAIATVVRPTINRSSASCTMCSLSLSSADVASSKRRIRGFRINARAIAIRCFCPPLSCAPRSPTTASYPSVIFSTNSCAFAARHDFSISSSGGSPSSTHPYATLARTLPLKSTGSWPTNAILRRNSTRFKWRTSRPSNSTSPLSGS
mmetsp:Transcript_54284/g.118071  ORF Transcript_54284/g.118071 Transcript_54284/m.118071 type:complete len:152 (-) Transcript_54284:636-1091(-)